MGRSGLSQKLAQKWQWWDGSRKKGQRFEDLYVITTLVKMHFLVILFFKKYMSFFLKEKVPKVQIPQNWWICKNVKFSYLMKIWHFLQFCQFWGICTFGTFASFTTIFGIEKTTKRWDFTSLGVRSNRILGRRMISISKNWFRTQICQIVRIHKQVIGGG